MIWYKIKEIEKQLSAGEVSDYLAFKYLLAKFILFTLAASIPGHDHDPMWSQGIHLVIALSTLIWGFTKTFEINEAGDSRDYLKRFFSLSLVAGIRLVVYMFMFSAVLTSALLIAKFYKFPLRRYTWDSEVFELFGFLLFSLIYYFTLVRSFKRINSAGGGENALRFKI